MEPLLSVRRGEQQGRQRWRQLQGRRGALVRQCHSHHPFELNRDEHKEEQSVHSSFGVCGTDPLLCPSTLSPDNDQKSNLRRRRRMLRPLLPRVIS